MKRIIYTAVALIICASAFGIADYLTAKKEGALVNYREEIPIIQPVIPSKKTEVLQTAFEEKVTTPAKKKYNKESKFQKKASKVKFKKDYPEIIPTPGINEKTKDPILEKMDIPDLVLQSKVTDSILQPDTKRKLSMEMFSRAPIREKKIKKK